MEEELKVLRGIVEDTRQACSAARGMVETLDWALEAFLKQKDYNVVDDPEKGLVVSYYSAVQSDRLLIPVDRVIDAIGDGEEPVDLEYFVPE